MWRRALMVAMLKLDKSEYLLMTKIFPYYAIFETHLTSDDQQVRMKILQFTYNSHTT